MADQGAQDRNLPASERKLRKAREDGQVARSRDLGHLGAVAAGLAMLALLAPTVAGWLETLVIRGLTFDRGTVAAPAAMSERLAEFGVQFTWAVAPLGGVMMAVALATGMALGGWNFSVKALKPKFEKFNVLTSVPKLVSIDRLIDTLRTCALALALGTVGGLYLAFHFDDFAAALALPLPAAVSHVGGDVLAGLALLVLTLAVFAAFDVPIQMFQHAKRLKMSHQEVKQEHKELEGNQEIKAKLKVRMREMANRRMLGEVPKADLVVMNPTHYAVALKYDESKTGAPRVVAKGADLMAMRIRDAAKGADVPVLQAPVLARALYAHAELDRDIPVALYSAVAQVLAYVYQLRAAMSGRAQMPGALPELQVPRELDPHNAPTAGATA
ncbi:MAG: EscU/YscU/HrcU family type III secretion system export apparatus switch protein [Methylibium sp.]|nr:EscU/YscU/HrcU family type III secretion system export apparatus switch protein [Methylibium sp.]